MTANDSEQRWTIRSADDFGRTIADLRAKRGLTQEQLAQQSGLSRNYLSQLETGRTSEMLERVLRLLRRLDVDVTVSARNLHGDG